MNLSPRTPSRILDSYVYLGSEGSVYKAYIAYISAIWFLEVEEGGEMEGEGVRDGEGEGGGREGTWGKKTNSRSERGNINVNINVNVNVNVNINIDQTINKPR